MADSVSGPESFLLAGVSVRMLAQSAARAGIRPICLDWFADADTAESSAICLPVSGPHGFDPERLLDLADRYAPAGGGAALIYGGGFDADPDLLSRLARGRVLCGNAPSTMRLVKTPRKFFGLLDRLGIPYPEVRWKPPAETEESGSWLLKQAASQGGLGVGFPARDRTGRYAWPAGAYFQRMVAGPARSALFMANGEEARIIGINTLWISDHLPQHPFLFAGACSHEHLRRPQRAAFEAYAVALTRALSLRGINSLDVMIDGEEARVLELNPRPSATMMLYDADYPEGLLKWHIDACRQRRLPPPSPSRVRRAFRILYARRSAGVPAGFEWPDWCADRPRAGTSIAYGHPVCSILAESPDRSALERQLSERERVIRASLMF